MISFYKIKPKFQKLLKPILVGLYKLGITANQITVSSIILSFLIGFPLWFHPDYRWGLLVVPIGLLIRMALFSLVLGVQNKIEESTADVAWFSNT